ncbi:MAG TPA: flavodoxin domain-containing protein [Kofleriaceae bacterium]|nr:flavodoxin domain-containing protein [Kofleriaceae bacterium]
MRVLVTWGSKRGGTEGIGREIAATLEARGFVVDARPAPMIAGVRDVDAVIVGGGLYANRWQADARRFVGRHLRALRRVPVWFFSSGPLDASADDHRLEPAPEVRTLMERVGAQGHVTFGGRLAPDARGFPARAMAKKSSGDWRNPARIRAWTEEVADALPRARPRPAIVPAGRPLRRLVGHAVLGWAACAAILFGLMAILPARAALVLHAIAAPLVFGAVAWRYFRVRGARAPLPSALTFAGVTAALDVALVAGALGRGLAMFRSFTGTWLPLALVVVVAWAVGGVMAMLPFPKAPPARAHREPPSSSASSSASPAASAAAPRPA